jgi:hypothetical protein
MAAIVANHLQIGEIPPDRLPDTLFETFVQEDL